MKYYIENELLKVGINSYGGSLTNIIDKIDGEEMLYQPLENSWKGQDVVIFPVVGKLKDKKYTVDSKEYKIESHGLIRYDNLELFEQKSDEITFIYYSNSLTLEQYPYDFEFKVNYKLIGKTVKVSYLVNNTSDSTMFYGIGGHPAFICDGIFTEKEFDLKGNYVGLDCIVSEKYLLNETGSNITGKTSFNQNVIELSKEFFRKELTLIIGSDTLKSATLFRKNGKKVVVKMESNKYVALWSDEYFGNYCAIEPWWSLPDFVDNDSELKNKQTFISQEAHTTKKYSYEIEII